MGFAFTPSQRSEIDSLCARYPTRRAALLPVLWIVQRQEGFVSGEAMEEIARVLDITPAAVLEVVTFYSMYQRTHTAKYHLQVCRTIGCWLRGAGKLSKYLQAKLDIAPGEHTADGLFQLSEVECLASCGTAPMCQINDDYYENLTPAKVDALLDELRAHARTAK